MSYPGIKETFYRTQGQKHVVLTVPHGADAKDFLQAFPEIEAHPEMQKIWPLFETYLAIEKDFGATELSHALAYELALQNVSSRVVEIHYPRGILDGGRLRDHALRPCLPSSLLENLQKKFLAIHEESLQAMDQLYKNFAKHESFLIDVHTMASFCPVDDSGRKSTIPVSFPRLKDYVEQYLNAKNHAYQRKIDLICADENGRKLADPKLLASVAHELSLEGYSCLENEPYHAAPIYLSYQHMQMVPSLSLDIPKHLVAHGDDLDQLEIAADNIRRLAKTLARAILKAFA